MEKKQIIKIEKLEKGFSIGNRFNLVLKNIDLEIYKGELITIFGPSGCGKSTLLNIIMGIERPDSGNIKIFGIDLWNMNADDRADIRKRNIGVVYQQQNWIKSLSVIENIAMAGQLLGLEKSQALLKAEGIIALVGLTEYQDQYTTELSSGEQQKAGLARSLMSNPQVIIADEPTGNLDTKSGYDVLNILQSLVAEGKTVVLVTHNPEYLEYSDRVIVMKDGEIIDVVGKMTNVREYVEKEIGELKKKEPLIKQTFKNNIKKKEELDYPRVSLIANISIYSSLFLKFFLESMVLLFTTLFSKYFKNNLKAKALNFVRKLEKRKKISKEIYNIELTELALKNLLFKKFRTIVTILGVGLGTGFVLLLLSLGYGFEKIVVDQMTSAQDLKQLDVYPKIGSQLLLNDELVDKMKNVSGVDKVYKLKNFAGRLSFEGSTSDVVVYGIEENYLQNSPSKKIAGEYLTSNSENSQILVNTEYLKLFGIEKGDILGKTLEISFVSSTPVKEDKKEPKKVTVIGVIEDDYPPVAYLKLESVSEYTDENYSEATVIVNSESSLDFVRKQVESLGLESFSVMDTISQVESLFAYIRYGLLFFGIVAFSISFLGMVNTLVVSLLERTREVGLMKIIGMKKNEIMTIFITESMFIGFLGGILGIILGSIGGYIVSLIIYAFSASKGVEFVAISYVPSYIILLVVVCTTLLGFLTGLYPAKRAVKIPPLDALRYE